MLRARGKKNKANEPRHDKTNKLAVRPTKTQISLGIRPVWSESSLSAWRKLGSFATHWAHSEDSDQTGRPPRLIWVFVGFIMSRLLFRHSCSGLVERKISQMGLIYMYMSLWSSMENVRTVWIIRRHWPSHKNIYRVKQITPCQNLGKILINLSSFTLFHSLS